ncbi:MAG: 4-hydroxy-tetrahydrodipicolinate reductase, partial [Candidatus Thorarchaeota archaeon]
MIKLLILGATGSMGRLISKLALEDNEIEVVAACDVSNIGDMLSNIAGTKDPNKIIISNVENLQEIIVNRNPDVAVDFSIAKATENNCKICVKNGIRCVIGTTGLSEKFFEEFEKLVKEYKAPAVISSNMATGVNIFFKMVSILTSYLEDWDIEIIEAHHHRKRDSPSGTALTIGKIIGDTIGSEFNDIAKFGRNLGPNKRLVGA